MLLKICPMPSHIHIKPNYRSVDMSKVRYRSKEYRLSDIIFVNDLSGFVRAHLRLLHAHLLRRMF